jgi:ribose 5-phosphate isomerase A
VLAITIDGADEVAPNLNLIKGRGGALLHEKIVAQATKQMIIAVDESKLVPKLGTHAPLPIEVIPFGWRTQAIYLETLGAKCVLRRNDSGQPYLTDEHNYILDCAFGPITAVEGLAMQLQAHAGIVAHGLFLGLAHHVVVAGPQGIRELE